MILEKFVDFCHGIYYNSLQEGAARGEFKNCVK